MIIAKRLYKRVQLLLPSQYGKSLSVALGVLIRVSNKKEKWAIVAPTEDKARIIMDYIIEHIYDSPLLISLLDYNGTKEQLLKERSKTRITFRGFGEVRIYTADATNMQKVEKALAGFGAPNVIIDESAIIPDRVYAMIKRMVGGTKDNFILEIGNPFFKNHFWRTWIGTRYWKIFVDYIVALKEGRFTEDFIEEMKEEAMFDVLYGSRFSADEQAPTGYRRLVSDSVLANAMIKQPLPIGHDEAGHLIDRPILGIDPNHGGKNNCVFVLRFPITGFAMVVLKKQYKDEKNITKLIVADAVEMIKKWEVTDYRVGIDAGGIGAGVADGLEEIMPVQPVMFGQSPENKERYANAKAELYLRCRKWIVVENGKLVIDGETEEDNSFLELKEINYKENTSSKTIMESKEELSKRGVASPDTADALALTFINVSDIVDSDDDPDII